MRRTLAAVLIVLLFARELPARSNHNWENIKKLKPGTNVRVLLWSGQELSGAVDAVSAVGLRLATVGSNGPGVGWLRDIDRASIRRIVRIRKPNLPDPKRWMIRSAVAGGAIGLTAGAVSDVKHGDNYHWFGGAQAERSWASSPHAQPSQRSGLPTSRRQCVAKKLCTRIRAITPFTNGNFGPA